MGFLDVNNFWKSAGVTALVLAVTLRKYYKPWLVRLKLGVIRYVMNRTITALTDSGKNLVCEVGKEKVTYKETGETIEYRVFTKAPKTLHFLYLQSQSCTNKDFIVYTGIDGSNLARRTYGDVLADSAALRYALTNQLGCAKGDRVSILMSNIPEFVTCFVSSTSLGAIAVTLNAFWAGEEIMFGLKDSSSKILLVDEKRLKRLLIQKEESSETTTLLQDLLNSGLKVVLIGAKSSETFKNMKGIYDFSSLLAAEIKTNKLATTFDSDNETTGKVSTDDDAVIMYTSGTSSGKPKGVVLTHRSMTQTTYCYVLFSELLKNLRGPSKVQRSDLITSPLFHAASLSSAFLFAFTQGNKLVFMPRWNPESAIKIFMEEKITYCGLMPTMLSDLLACKSFEEHKHMFVLTNLGTGGAHCPSGLINKTFIALPNTSQGSGWGLTESNSIGTVIGGPEYVHNPLSCGRPHFINDVKIVNPESGEDITEANEPGELWIKSVTRMRCYWNQPDATKEVITKDGWLRSGDIGKQDENGLYYIVDRIKDLVIRGGENISCAEVEDVLYEISDNVREACVFGLSHNRLGEQVCAVLYMTGSDLTPEGVKSYVSTRLAKHKVPTHVFLTDKPLPRGGTGKILKRVISANYKKYAN